MVVVADCARGVVDVVIVAIGMDVVVANVMDVVVAEELSVPVLLLFLRMLLFQTLTEKQLVW